MCRVALMKHQCEMQRMYRLGNSKAYKKSIKNSTVRKQIEVLVKNDRMKKSNQTTSTATTNENSNGNAHRGSSAGLYSSLQSQSTNTRHRNFSFVESGTSSRHGSISGGSSFNMNNPAYINSATNSKSMSLNTSSNTMIDTSSTRRGSLDRCASRRRSGSMYRLFEKQQEQIKVLKNIVMKIVSYTKIYLYGS